MPLRALVAAAPLALLALAFVVVRHTGRPFAGMDAYALGRVMAIETVALHAFVFLIPFTALRAARPEIRALMWLGVGLLTWLYGVLSYRIAGFQGIVMFAGLSVFTYFGAFVTRLPAGQGLRLSARWLANMVLLAVAAAASHAPRRLSPNDTETMVGMGVWFFTLGALLEASGFYHLERWARWEEAREGFWTAHREIEGRSYPLRDHLRLGVVPVLGTLVLSAAPLALAALLAGAFTANLDAGVTGDWREHWFERQRALKTWIPPLVAGILMSWRGLQTVWVTRTLRQAPDRGWWRSGILPAFLAGLGAVYAVGGHRLAAAGWRESGALFALPVLGAFVAVEVVVLLVLAPLTWRSIVRVQSRV